jgi:hypothetical protein
MFPHENDNVNLSYHKKSSEQIQVQQNHQGWIVVKTTEIPVLGVPWHDYVATIASKTEENFHAKRKIIPRVP